MAATFLAGMKALERTKEKETQAIQKKANLVSTWLLEKKEEIRERMMLMEKNTNANNIQQQQREEEEEEKRLVVSEKNKTTKKRGKSSSSPMTKKQKENKVDWRHFGVNDEGKGFECGTCFSLRRKRYQGKSQDVLDRMCDVSETFDQTWWYERKARANGHDTYVRGLRDGETAHETIEENGDLEVGGVGSHGEPYPGRDLWQWQAGLMSANNVSAAAPFAPSEEGEA